MVSLFSVANEMNEEEKNLYIHVNHLCSLNLALVFKMFAYLRWRAGWAPIIVKSTCSLWLEEPSNIPLHQELSP